MHMLDRTSPPNIQEVGPGAHSSFSGTSAQFLLGQTCHNVEKIDKFVREKSCRQSRNYTDQFSQRANVSARLGKEIPSVSETIPVS